MMFPHTVTVYNVITEEDKDFHAQTVNYVTVLKGVLVDETKGRNVRMSGLTSADAVIMYIPRDVVAVDGITGQPKQYAKPMEFFNSENKSDLWTLSVDAGTFFVKGLAVETNYPLFSPSDYDGVLTADNYLFAVKTDKELKPITEQYMNLKYDSIYTVSSVDDKDFGGLSHWEVGGKH